MKKSIFKRFISSILALLMLISASPFDMTVFASDGYVGIKNVVYTDRSSVKTRYLLKFYKEVYTRIPVENFDVLNPQYTFERSEVPVAFGPALNLGNNTYLERSDSNNQCELILKNGDDINLSGNQTLLSFFKNNAICRIDI